jgi:hypothetical protein
LLSVFPDDKNSRERKINVISALLDRMMVLFVLQRFELQLQPKKLTRNEMGKM